MTLPSAAEVERLWTIVGWSMIHYLWVGAAIGALALLLRVVLRGAKPGGRYACSLVAFGLLAGAGRDRLVGGGGDAAGDVATNAPRLLRP